MTMQNNINCPYCGKSIEISQAFKKQIENEIKEHFSQKHQKELTDAIEKARLDTRHEFEEKQKLEWEDLRKQLQEQKETKEKMRTDLLELLREKRKLEDKDKEREFEMEKKLDLEKKKIEEEVSKREADKNRLKELENEKRINDLKKALEEAQRKASQGSQQLQGEVLELDIETMLRTSFPNDTIEPVAKGVTGADIQQVVKSPKGIVCGVILWEIKRTKTWSDGWIDKLKKDLREQKANFPVIVTTSLPKSISSGLGKERDVWVTSYSFVLPLAELLRKALLDVGFQKQVNLYRGDKAHLLYEYITSNEFVQQIESIVEVHKEIKGQIDKERIAFEKIWKARENQALRIITSTARIAGSMQGLIGSSLPELKGLAFELSSGKE